MGRPVQVINGICRGKNATTTETTLDLERALGMSARFGLNLQVDYDLTLARLARSIAA